MPSLKRQFSGIFRGLDVRPDRVDFRDREYRPPLRSLPPEYPSNDDIGTFLSQYLKDGMILDQGSEGACTGFGLAAVINYIYWEALRAKPADGGRHALPERVSSRMLYNNARLYDEWDGEDYEGSSCRGALKGWHKHGVCNEILFPYDDKQFVRPEDGWDVDAIERPLGAYYRVDALSIVDMQAGILETHAVYASAKVHDGWSLGTCQSFGGAVIRQNGLDARGGHAFALVGYNRHGFIVQNSWGERWGFCGFGLLPYDDWVRNGYDAWVVAAGAPVATSPMPTVLATQPLVAQSGIDTSQPRSAAASSRTGAVTAWTETEAYRRAIVCGNNGGLLRRLSEAENAEDNLKILFECAARRIEDGSCREVLFFAHGGITSERAAIRHVQRLGPYLEANGVYPLFLVWKTGLAESLSHIVRDSIEALGEAVDEMRAKGFVEDVIQSLKEKRDRSFEFAARHLIGMAVWSQIKQNAEAAAVGKGSIRSITGEVKGLLADYPGLDVHVTGYSAGSIWLGHMLDDFRQARLADGGTPPVKTATLWVPACSTEFAGRYFGNALSRGIVRKGGLHIDLLSDDLEQADHVVSEKVYGKSILYLVSRALEARHKTPLLGLQNALPEHWEDALNNDLFDPDSKSALRRWARIVADWKVAVTVHDNKKAWNGVSEIPVSHSSFDNDVAVNTAMLKRILGREPRVPIDNLAFA